ncbi:thymidylate synthase [Halorhodospira neutriphila]|uniref:Thymidylate synthase n=1 Tax=Halorhodospira neutriphila TaxID=168379 RepID=A0ABS1E271_9GAMM|nr:thymidylate synthase [Halorhodospira neutriphila]MBK1725573.1 thymidylate synthase [Halorhodospira neutriphila]
MRAYLDLFQQILERGADKGDRTGTGTLSLFGAQVRSDLKEGFPLLTTRKVNYRAAFEEMLWFLRGETNINTLPAKIWDSWADATGSLGPIYGAQWRGQSPNQPIDQIAQVMEGLRTHPDSRRHVVSAWIPADLPEEDRLPHENAREGRMALAPCHTLMQLYTRPLSQEERLSLMPGRDSGGSAPERGLSLQLYQRSADMPVGGAAFNCPQYAMLTHLIAFQLGMVADEFIHTIGDAHIYKNQIEGVKEQLAREPRPLPHLRITARRERIEDYTAEDLEVSDYNPHPAIKFPIAV